MKDACIKSLALTLGLLCAGLTTVPLQSLAAPSATTSDSVVRDDDFIKIWDDLTPKLEQILDLEENHDSLPEHAIWGTDKLSNRRNINLLLDEAIDILALPGGTDYRARIRELEVSIRELQDQIAGYRQSQVSAPREAYWRNTVADYDEMIRASQERIGQIQQRIEATKQEFVAGLRKLGLVISDEQLDFLLSTVIGDDLVAVSLAFDNVKSITEQLEQLLVDSGEDLPTARRYYGMYTVLLTALEHMHTGLLTTIERYLQQLDSVVEKTRTLMAESKSLKKQDDRHQSTLNANIEAQELTLRTAKLYRSYLLEQADDINASRKQLAHDLAVARNTYETVKVSGELIAMVRSGQQLLELLFNRDVPTMFTFRNLEMKREFEKLTLQLREDGAR
jgi:hypothetical protein